MIAALDNESYRAPAVTRRLPRPAAVLVTAAVSVAAAAPAAAAGTATATEGPGSVSVSAGAAGTPGSVGDAGAAPSGPTVPCVTVGAPAWVAAALGGDTGAGRWVALRCGADQQGYLAPPQYVWVAAGSAAPAVDPGELAVAAEASLRLPAPVPATDPSSATAVNLPTWLWVDGSLWHPRAATAAAGGVAATAVATPVSVTWSTGDGATVDCGGPGTAWTGDPAATSDCTHTYRRPAAALTVQATVTWDVTWTAVGAPGGGSLPPLETTGRIPLGVREIETVEVP